MIKKCKICGNELYVKPSHYKKGKGRYCSKKCFYISRKGKFFGFGFKKGNIPWHKGKQNVYSKKSLKAMSNARKGKYAGSNHPLWKGGRYKDSAGYIVVYSPNHPFCNKDGCVKEHRLTMEKHLGRYLEPKEVVHHINNNPSDNRIENLKLFPNSATHIKFHFSKI